jgi:phasin family protein
MLQEPDCETVKPQDGTTILHCKKDLDFFVQCNISESIQLTGWRLGRHTQSAKLPERFDMVRIDEVQKLGKDNMDATLRSFGAFSKNWQAITVEIADYSKKVFEQSTAATEKLLGAKSLEKAIEVQSDYAKTAYETFVAEATKLGELYADLAREAYKPFETQFGKAASVK